MAEQAAVNSSPSDFESPMDLFSDEAILSPGFRIVESVPGTHDDILEVDPNRLLHLAERLGNKPSQAENENADYHQSYENSQFGPLPEDNIKQSFFELTRLNEHGIVEIDMEKLQKKMWRLNLDETTEEDPSQRELNLQSLKEKVTKFTETLGNDENSAKKTEPEKDCSDEEQETQNLTAFKYQKKNRLWDRLPHLRQMFKEFSLCEYDNVYFTEEGLETFSKSLMNHVELDLHCAVNTLRRIAYPKLCRNHFSSEFPSGAFAEDEPIENISINVDRFEFLQKKQTINFYELFKREDFNNFAFDLEKDPQINNIVPSFIEFLENGKGYQFPQNCFTLILAILKNPYHKLEVFFEQELPVVNEQVVIAEYLVNCLQILEILNDKNVYEKLAESIITFANVHHSFLALLLPGFSALLGNEKNDERAYQIYCKVLNIMTSIGGTVINFCLPQYFKKISWLATNNRKSDLYFHLLRACEISIANAIEHESWVKTKSSEEIDIGFYAACYNYFGKNLSTRLKLVFKKYEKRMYREEQYLSRKHSIFPTKNGYLNTEMRYLTRRNKIEESKSSNFPMVNKSTFKSADEILFNSNMQFGGKISQDKSKLFGKDLEYWSYIGQYPQFYMESLTAYVMRSNSLLTVIV